MLPIPSLLLALALAAAPAARAQPAAPAAATRPAAGFTSAQLVSALTHDLASHFHIEGDFELDLVRPWAPPALTASAWDVVVTEYPPMPASTMLVRFTVAADGAPVADSTLLVRGSLWRSAWYTREPITSGSTFDPTSLESRRVDCLRQPEALPATIGDDSFIFSSQLPANRLLTWRDIARRPLVRRGEVVDVVAEEGALMVTMKALAVQNGVRGDIITVRNIETRKDITGQVVAQDRVEVRF